LARSTAELLSIEADLSKRGIGLVVLSMGGERLDARNPTSKLMLTILAGVATFPAAFALGDALPLPLQHDLARPATRRRSVRGTTRAGYSGRSMPSSGSFTGLASSSCRWVVVPIAIAR
jgi:Resolvase, N terminal domain